MKDIAGWDIGRPQDPVRYLVESGQIQGVVLDVGCGTGLQTRYMASKGLEVLGVDFSTEAVHRAKQEAYERVSSVEFLVWNALELSQLNRSFDKVLDSGMMHCLERSERPEYVEELWNVLSLGGRVFVICSQENVPLWELEELRGGALIMCLRQVRVTQEAVYRPISWLSGGLRGSKPSRGRG